MNLFKKQPTKELPPLISDAELDGASYEQVIDYLTSVNKADFEKIIKVATTFRKAHCEVAKITGIETEPTGSIFDHETVPPVALPGDTELGDFLTEDDKPKKGRKVPVKNVK